MAITEQGLQVIKQAAKVLSQLRELYELSGGYQMKAMDIVYDRMLKSHEEFKRNYPELLPEPQPEAKQ